MNLLRYWYEGEMLNYEIAEVILEVIVDILADIIVKVIAKVVEKCCKECSHLQRYQSVQEQS